MFMNILKIFIYDLQQNHQEAGGYASLANIWSVARALLNGVRITVIKLASDEKEMKEHGVV